MTNDGPNKYIITAGVPQGLVLGPLLCNVKYNGVLLFLVADEVTLVGSADDLAIVIVAKLPEDVEVYAGESVMVVSSWLRRKRNTISLRVENHVTVSKPTITYLGVTLDAGLSFKGRIFYAC